MAWKIESQWDDGFLLTVDGTESRHGSFADASAGVVDPIALATIDAPLMPVLDADGKVIDHRRPASVFDAAYESEIDTRLSFDGAVFLVEVVGGDGARVLTIDDAQMWLERAIRSQLPDSIFAGGHGAAHTSPRQHRLR